MAYFSSESNTKSVLALSSIPYFQRFSLRAVKVITIGFVLCTSLGFLLLWQPAYHQLRSLQNEKAYWQHVMTAGATNAKTESKQAAIPSMDQLPDIIEQCRDEFVREGVDVASLNVERFGERRETGKGASLDYGLVRLHLRGNWENIVKSLKALEEKPEGNIHLQEVILNPEGGETLLQIYFSTGE